MNTTSNRDERQEAYYFVPESVVVAAVGVCNNQSVKMEGFPETDRKTHMA